jgi:hypothetical protein
MTSVKLSAKQRLRAAMADLRELNKRFMIAGGMVLLRDNPEAAKPSLEQHNGVKRS